ncbi:hairy-related 5 [Neosynchiropus ocellatus]
MKALASPESPRTKRNLKVPKPVMEKRRRERINHSLETLRLLMLESTDDKRLKNPKVEKAEILESVVHFLKANMDHQTKRSVYPEDMRSCLLRISHFISSEAPPQASPPPQSSPSPPAFQEYPPHHPTFTPLDSRKLLSPAVTSTDPVWRPWPQ